MSGEILASLELEHRLANSEKQLVITHQELKQAMEKIAELEKINDVQRESIWQVIFGEPELMDKCVGALQIKKQFEEIEVLKAKLEKVFEWLDSFPVEQHYDDAQEFKKQINSITIDSIKRGENGK